MTFTAKVNFNRCGRYQQPRCFHVLNPQLVRQDGGITDNVLHPLGIFEHRVPVIEDGWDADRFNFTLDIKFPSTMSHRVDGILLHGHTSAGSVLSAETRLYFDRIVGYSDVTMLAVGGNGITTTRPRYDVHIAAPQPPQQLVATEKYMLDYPTIMRRISSEMAFLHLRRDNDGVKNITGLLRYPMSFRTDELNPGYFGETIRHMVLGHHRNAEPGYDSEPIELYEDGHELARSVQLTDTRFFRALFQQSGYRQDSYITYGELVEFLSKDSSITVNTSTEELPTTPTAPASPEAERIFIDLARQAVVFASHEGFRTGYATIDCDPTDTGGKMNFVGATKMFEDFDNGEDDLYELERATEEAGSKLLPLATRTLAELYNVGYFNADIEFDVFGDIHGSVSIAGRGTQQFRIPAWYFGSFGGLVGTCSQIDTLAMVTKTIADISLLKASEV